MDDSYALKEELIRKLVTFLEKYGSLSEEDLGKTTPFTLGESEKDWIKRYHHMAEIIVLIVLHIVEFCNNIPFFNNLPAEDMITLLKEHHIQVMMLWFARKYDEETKSICFGDKKSYTREHFSGPSMGKFGENIFRFCETMCRKNLDDAEYALLTAYLIFSDTPKLQEPEEVKKLKQLYDGIYISYMERSRPEVKDFSGRLNSMRQMWILSKENSELISTIKVHQKMFFRCLE